MPRRSGKTTQLVALVDMFTMFGETPIWIVGCNYDMLRHIKHRIRGVNIPTDNSDIIRFGVVIDDFNSIHSPAHILVDEFQICSRSLLDLFKDLYEDCLIMFGTTSDPFSIL